MAKIALCGYGHDGRSYDETGNSYAYIVNDNVNVGDVLQVIATSRKGNKFVTTASPVEVHRESSMEGQLAKSWAESNASDGEINQTYSGKQLGVGGFRGSEKYKQETRARQMQVYQQEHPNAPLSKNASNLVDTYGSQEPITPKSNYKSFDEYSKPFMNGGNK